MVEAFTYPQRAWVAANTTLTDRLYFFVVVAGSYRIQQTNPPPGHVASPTYYVPLIHTLAAGEHVFRDIPSVRPTVTQTPSPTPSITPTQTPTLALRRAYLPLLVR